MASPMERDQGDDEILMSSKVSFSSTLYEQSFSTATWRRTFWGEIAGIEWSFEIGPKRLEGHIMYLTADV